VAAHPYLDNEGPIAIAHRGGAGDHPENTMPAFAAAVSRGYRYIETDVHVTADGALIAFHDDRLDRVTDRRGHISDLTWSEVSEARVGGQAPIPRFAELLTSFPDVRINIDPKSDAAVEPLIRELRQHERLGVLDRVCAGSFSDSRLEALHDAFGDRICLSAGPREMIRMKLATWGAPFSSFRARCAQVPVSVRGLTIVTERFVRRAHELGLRVHVWTIDEAQEMRRLLDLGVDGIMTDRLQVLLDVFDERDLPY